MAVRFERVREFARKHGRVDAFASPGMVAVLPNGNLDAIDYVEKATRFYFEGKSYTNEEFEKLIGTSD
jgi:hypothetical protein